MNRLAFDNEDLVEKTSEVNESSTGCQISSIDSIAFDRKIINIAEWIDEKIRKREKFFSLELFLSKKFEEDVYEKFISEVNRIPFPPLFYVTTWHERPTFDKDSCCWSLRTLKTFPNNTLLHIAANDLKKDEVGKILDNALKQGKTNVLALRGDSCTGNGDFCHAVDLVKFIRANYGNKFVICVAGYPQMHPESVSRKMDLFYLKQKVDAGASFVITQIFLETNVFVHFVEDCKKNGINIPIIPGIFPIPNYKTLMKMAKLCSFEIPKKVLHEIEPIKDNDQKVYDYGISLAGKIIREIFACEVANGFHLYTLNRVSVVLDVCREVFN